MKVFFKRHGATILTTIGAIGVVATAVTAVKATPKATVLLKEAKKEKGEPLTKLEKIKTAGPAYIPALIVGASTIACIFGANALNKRQQAALMSAYALLDSSYKEYKNKVKDLLGEEAEQEIREELAKDKYPEEGIQLKGDNILFYDDFSNRYFQSTLYDVQRAEYSINRDLMMRDYATLNEFYSYLGLEPIKGGDDLGWSISMNQDYYWQTWIDFSHYKTVMDDGLECHVIAMFQEPNLHWHEY